MRSTLLLDPPHPPDAPGPLDPSDPPDPEHVFGLKMIIMLFQKVSRTDASGPAELKQTKL